MERCSYNVCKAGEDGGNRLYSTLRTAAVALLILVMCIPLTGWSTPPIVNCAMASQRTDTNIVDIYYDLADADSPSLSVSLLVSTNSGFSFDVAAASVSGDVGTGVTTGTAKHIVWNLDADFAGKYSPAVSFLVCASDGSPTMAPVPGGLFAMGNSMAPGEGDASELPVHTVSVSSFQIDRCEVTEQVWDDVCSWAVSNGYSFDNAGSGKATNHPVQSINWFDCVKWCNARSEREGRTPCYYTDAAHTQVYRTGRISLINDAVNWTTNGYRLPTEAEWEKAARGGAAGNRFPWTDTNVIQHAMANYWSEAVYGYDTSTTRGYHPTFDEGGYPHTSPVGYFVPNGYGLEDMAGNVWEWCWDWHDTAWYSNGMATAANTRGPVASGSGCRVLRGGSWNDDAVDARCAMRDLTLPDNNYNDSGFRCVGGAGCVGTALTAVVSIDTLRPATVSASDGTYTNKVAVSWSESTNATKYAVWRNTSSSTSGAANISGDITATNYEDTVVVPGTIYWYWVQAGNAGGWSGLSTGDSGYAEAMTVVVDVTNADTKVKCDVTTYVVSGTNNPQVVGMMWISNITAGGVAASFPAAPSWTAPAVVLRLGVNRIHVWGTNAAGVVTSDDVSIWRYNIDGSGQQAGSIYGQRSRGPVIGWGEGGSGQTNSPAGNDIVAIAAGLSNSLLLRVDGSILEWGDGKFGETNSPPGTNYVAIVAGCWHSVALRNDGTLVGWGTGGLTNCPAGNNYVAIAAGSSHSLALRDDGTLVAWNSTNCPAGSNYVAIADGEGFSLALRSDGTLVGWGTGISRGETNCPPGSNYVAIAAGYDAVTFNTSHCLALRSDGTIVGWGDNTYGQTNCPSGSNYVAIAAGNMHCLALRNDGTVVSWGTNILGTITCPVSNNCIAIAACGYHSLAIMGRTPFIDITNAYATVASTVTNYRLGGTNNLYIAGTIVWTNSLGGNGAFAASPGPACTGWEFNVTLALGSNVVTVTGTNTAGAAANDSVMIIQLDPPTYPYVNITNQNVTVPSAATALMIGLSNNMYTVGMLSWTNSLGGSGCTNVGAPWRIFSVSLGFGTNVITVSGTNTAGIVRSDQVAVTRTPNTQHVDITNVTGTATVAGSVTNYVLRGTNNMYTVGKIVWTNSLGGNGSVPASSTGWSFTATLAVGSNVVTVVGTNTSGMAANDSVTIIRLDPPTYPYVNITNQDVTVPSATTTASIGLSNNIYTVGTLWWTNSLGGSGSTNVGAPWRTFSVPLQFGANAITVSGTNTAGIVRSDRVVITRTTNWQNGVWISTVGGFWHAYSNWQSGLIAGGSGSTADFSTLDITTDVTVTLGAGYNSTNGHLKFSDTIPNANWFVTGSYRRMILAAANGMPCINVATQSATIAVALGGDNGMRKIGDGSLKLPGGGNYTNSTVIEGGELDLSEGGIYTNNAAMSPYTGVVVSNATLKVKTLTVGAASSLGLLTNRTYFSLPEPSVTNQVPSSTIMLLDGGTIEIVGGSHTNLRGFIAVNNGGTIRVTNPATVVTWRSDTINPVYYHIYIWSTLTLEGAGSGVFIDKLITGTGGVTVKGLGTWTFGSNQVYSGTTTVNGGTLIMNGRLYFSPVVVGSGGTLMGIGTISNSVTVNGVISAGGAATTCGTLFVNGDVLLSGSAVTHMELDRSTSPNADRLMIGGMWNTGVLCCAGTLAVTNIGDALQAGDAFDLFDSLTSTTPVVSGSFDTISLPLLSGSLRWNTNSLYTTGVISIEATTGPSVDITNASFAVGVSAATASIGGTNNAAVVGGMRLVSMTGTTTNYTASVPAAASWTAVVSNLVAGATNFVTITATNTQGDAVSDMVEIYRDQQGQPGDVELLTVDRGAEYGQVSLSWSNGTITVLACTNRIYGTNESDWFVLSSGVSTPWTHTAASNFPSIYYRIVSGSYTSSYDVGKFDVSIAAGSIAWISFPFGIQPSCNILSEWFGRQLDARVYSSFNFPSLQRQSTPGGTIENSDYYTDDFGGGTTNFFPDSAAAANAGYVLFLPKDHGAVKVTAIGMVQTNSVTMQIPYNSVPWVGLAYPITLDMRDSSLADLFVPAKRYSTRDYDYIDSQRTPGGRLAYAEYYIDDWGSGTTNFFPSRAGADKIEGGKGYLLFFSTTRTGTGVWTCVRPY